jgi:hypothetical protein
MARCGLRTPGASDEPVFPSRPIDSNVEEAIRRNVNRHRDDRRDGRKDNQPQPLGLMLNHLQRATEVCIKSYNPDGFMAL